MAMMRLLCRAESRASCWLPRVSPDRLEASHGLKAHVYPVYEPGLFLRFRECNCVFFKNDMTLRFLVEKKPYILHILVHGTLRVSVYKVVGNDTGHGLKLPAARSKVKRHPRFCQLIAQNARRAFLS